MAVTPPAKTGSKPTSPSSLSPADTPFGQFKDTGPLPTHHVRMAESRDRRASSVSFQTGGPPLCHFGSGASNPTTPRNGQSPSSGHLSANKTHVNVYRNTRDAYYKQFELTAAEQSDGSSPRRTGSDTACEARCHQLASAALALSYLLADLRETKGRIPTLRVTYEDIIVALKLPLQYATHNHLTFHQLHRIIQQFVAQDERLKEDYEVIATTFDTRRTDGTVQGLTLVEEETGRRASVMTATELRSTISDDGLTFDRVKIACYDAEIVAAENVIEVDEKELESNELLSNVIGDGVRPVGDANEEEIMRRPSTRSGCSVIADIQRSKNEVHLLQIYSVEPLKVRRVDVPIKTLHDALSARNPDSQRAQGIIEIRRKDSLPDITSEGTMGVSIGIDGPGLQKMLFSNDSSKASTGCSSKCVSIFGDQWARLAKWDTATCPTLEYYDFTLGDHLLTTAVALHLLNQKRFPRIDVNQIFRDLKLPAACARSGGALHMEQWYTMLQTFGEMHQLHTEFLPLSRHVRKPGSTPFVSVGALSEFLRRVTTLTTDANHQQAVVMTSFHGGKARNALNYFRPQENTISYAIVGGFDAESDTVLLIDCDIKRNELEWTISVDELHAAMTDHGLVVLCETASAKAVQALMPSLDAWGDSQRRVPKYTPLPITTLSNGESLCIPAPFALLSLASQRIGKSVKTVDEVLHQVPCSISHALFPHPSLFDVARLFNAVHGAQDDIVAYCHNLSVDRTLKKKTNSTAFAALLKSLLDDGAQVIVNCSRFLLTHSPHWEGQACPNFALVLAQASNDTVVLCDTHEAAESRIFQVTIHELFKACEDPCAVSRRPKGFVVIAQDALKAKMLRTEHSRLPLLHFHTPTCHAFRSAGPPQIVALAMAATALGYPARPSSVYYAAVEGASDNDACVRTLRPLSRVRRTITLSALIETANRYFAAMKQPLEASACAGSSRLGYLTRDDLKPILKQPIKKEKEGTEHEVYVCVYDAKQAHDVAGEFCGAGVILGHDDETSEVVVLNSEPSTWGEVWRSTLTSALECFIKDPEDADREHFGVLKISRKEKEKEKEKDEKKK